MLPAYEDFPPKSFPSWAGVAGTFLKKGEKQIINALLAHVLAYRIQWDMKYIHHKNKSNNFALDKTDLFLLRQANKKGEWWLPIKPAVHFSPSRPNKTPGKLFALYPTMTSFHNFLSSVINYLFTYSSDIVPALFKLWASINLTNSLCVVVSL